MINIHKKKRNFGWFFLQNKMILLNQRKSARKCPNLGFVKQQQLYTPQNYLILKESNSNLSLKSFNSKKLGKRNVQHRINEIGS